MIRHCFSVTQCDHIHQLPFIESPLLSPSAVLYEAAAHLTALAGINDEMQPVHALQSIKGSLKVDSPRTPSPPSRPNPKSFTRNVGEDTQLKH